MKKTLTLASLALMTLSLYTPSALAAVSNAKAIKLAPHRVDRLVALNKLDKSFVTKMEKVEVVVVENQAPVYFKATVSQTAPATGNPVQVQISLDQDGKPLAFQLVAGGIAGPDSAWPGKTAGELTENALHYVLENAASGKIALFDKSATSVTLTKANLNNEAVALGQVRSSATTEKLNIYLKMDGSLIKAEVVP